MEGDPDLDACGGGGGQDALLSPHQPVLAGLVFLRRHFLLVPLLQPRHKLLVLAQRHLAVRLQTQARGDKPHCRSFKNQSSVINHINANPSKSVVFC